MNPLDILREGAAQGASDIHIVPGCAPLFRINGQLLPVPNRPVLTPEQAKQTILQLLSEQQRARLVEEYTLDFSLSLDNRRFRGNILFQRNGLEAILRIIPVQIPGPDDILLPPVITDLINLKSGLVLVTGATGAGKSTTLACLIDLINQKRRGNIITIEDPIEFVYSNKNCVISQREIGLHATTFAAGLRSVMRQDPDVVMIGEMRDLETIAAAITMAETGILILATLHSSDAPQAIDRMIDVFPGRQQQQIRTQLSNVLRAVVSQSLLLRTGGGRVALREVMLVNAAIGNLIRVGKTHEIYSAMEMGVRQGMITPSQALSDLAKKGLIDSHDLQNYARIQERE